MKKKEAKINEDIMIQEDDLKAKRDRTNPQEKVEKEIQEDADQAPYEDDFMPDSPKHGVISSRPDLFEEDEEPLVGAGTVSESTEDYDEENIEEYSTPD